jgi:cytosine/adenosine deaminase-related metal-dependent hydrolase
MRLVVRLVLGSLALLATTGAALYWIVQPPAPLALPERGATLDGVTVIEPGRSRSEARRVVVRGERIEAVEAARGGDGPWTGLYVTPGLTDLHVHFPPASLPGQAELFAFQLLRHGVTAVRDAGDVDGTATEPARSGVAAGRFPGPRIAACGYLVDGEPPLWKNTLLARNPDEGRRAVERVAAEGFDCVKAYTELDAPTLAAIREAAHAKGIPVIGHVPRRIPYEEARLDDAQHLIGIPPPPDDPELRFPFVMRQWERLDDARLDHLVVESVRLRIANTPTLVTIDRLIGLEDYPRMLREPDAAYLPRFYRDVVWNPNGGITPAGQLGADDFAMLRRALAAMQRTVKRLADAGARVHTGSDTLIAFVVPGAALHRELRLLVGAGLTPEQALRLSMLDSAAALGVEGLGQIRAGAPAELLVFRDDPTRDLEALDSLAAVVRDGRLYTRASLDAQAARYRAHHDGALYDAIVTPLVRRVLAATRR